MGLDEVSYGPQADGTAERVLPTHFLFPSLPVNLSGMDATLENGHAPTNGDTLPQIKDLREQVERENLETKLAIAKHERVVLEHQKQLMESAVNDFGNWVNPATPLFDDPDFFAPYIGENLPFNIDNRLKGELLPVYITEYGLKLLRDYSRWMAAFNPYAISALENRVSYVIHTGMGITAVPARRNSGYAKGDRELCEMCQDVWDDFADRVDWGRWEQDTLKKVDVDGEAFIRFFHTGGGKVTIRPIEPEHVRSPGDQSAAKSFGIQTPEFDIMDTLGYWVVLNPGYSWNPTFVDAREVLHIKQGGGPSAKRGYPLLIPIRQNLQRAVNLLQYMSALARAQSAIAMTRKWKQYSAASVSAWQQNNADVQGANWLGGGQRFGKQYGPATVLDIPENVDYDFPSTKIGASALVEVLQAELRAVGSRLVMPEYMISGDASNANYSSTLVAESPAVKNFERVQASYARYFGDGRKGEPRHCGVFWRVIRAAVDWKLLPREVLTRVKAHVEPPMVAARDKQKDTERSKTLNEAGVLSKETWSKQEGLERDREKSQIEKEAAEAPQVPGQVPSQFPEKETGADGATGTPPNGKPPQPGKSGSGVHPCTPGGEESIDPARVPEMAADAKQWIQEMHRLAKKSAPEIDEQALADAIQQHVPGEKREVGEGCEPNATGHGFHDSETGAPCSQGGKPGVGPQKPGQAEQPGRQSPHLDGMASKVKQLLHAAGKHGARLAEKGRATAVKYAQKRFADLESKYGRAGAIAVLSAVVAMTPVPVPGSSLAPLLIAEGARHVLGRLSGPKLQPATEQVQESFTRSVQRALRACMEAKDAQGHEHKGEGPGGGQFTGDGGIESVAKNSGKERIGKSVWGVRDEDEPVLESHADSCEQILQDKKFASAVKWYSGKGYESLNETARKCPPEFSCLDQVQRKKFDAIESAIAKAPKFKEPVLLYRSIDGTNPMLNDRLKKSFQEAFDNGDEFSFPSLTSTSSDPGIVNSESFGGLNGIAFQIRAKTGLSAKSVSNKPQEKEIIQSAKTKYKVAGLDTAEFYGRKRFTVYLEEV
jgi:hypothetical protein